MPAQVRTFPGQASKRAECTLLAPAHAMAQRSDVRDVMFTMPGVRRQHIIESHRPSLGMREAARKVRGPHATQQDYPPFVQCLEQSERYFDGGLLRII
jgi:hypothetical protein